MQWKHAVRWTPTIRTLIRKKDIIWSKRKQIEIIINGPLWNLKTTTFPRGWLTVNICAPKGRESYLLDFALVEFSFVLKWLFFSDSDLSILWRMFPFWSMSMFPFYCSTTIYSGLFWIRKDVVVFWMFLTTYSYVGLY